MVLKRTLVIASSFTLVVLDGMLREVVCDSICVQDVDSCVAVPPPAQVRQHLSCGNAAGAQRPEVISTQGRGLEETWKGECLLWTLKNWLDFSWRGI